MSTDPFADIVAQHRGASADPFAELVREHQAKQPRTWGEVATDTLQQLGEGANNLANTAIRALDDSVVGDVVRIASGGPSRASAKPDPLLLASLTPEQRAAVERRSKAYLEAETPLTTASAVLDRGAQYWHDKQSVRVQDADQYVQRGDGALDTAMRYLERPEAIASAFVRNAPQAVPFMALGAAEAPAALNVLMGAGMSSQDARQQAKQDAQQQGASAVETLSAMDAAGDVGMATGIAANLIGLKGEMAAMKALTQKVPLGISRPRQIAQELALQPLEEFADEAGSRYAANVGGRAYNPEQDLMAGVATAGVHGAMAAGPQGVITGGLTALRGESADSVAERNGPKVRVVDGTGLVENLDNPEQPPMTGAIRMEVGGKIYWADPGVKAGLDAQAALKAQAEQAQQAQNAPTLADMPDLSGWYGQQDDDADDAGGPPVALTPTLRGALSVGADTGLGLTGQAPEVPTAPVFPDPQAGRISYGNGLDFEAPPVPGKPALSLAPKQGDEAGGIPFAPGNERMGALAAGVEALIAKQGQPTPALTPQTGKKTKAPKPVRVPDWTLTDEPAASAAPVAETMPTTAPAPSLSAAGATPTTPKAAKGKAFSTIDARKDDLLTAIAKAGGLSREAAEAQGIDPAEFGRRAKAFGAGPVFRKSGGMGFDEMAELLSQHGYPVHDDDGRYSGNTLLARVDDSLRGNRVLTPQGIEHEAARQAQMRAEEEALRAGDHEAVEALAPAEPDVPQANADERLAARLYGEAMAAGYGVDQIESLFEQGDSAATYHRKLQGLLNGDPEYVERAKARRAPALSSRNGPGSRQGADEAAQPGATRAADNAPDLDAAGHDSHDFTDDEVDRLFAGEHPETIRASRSPALELSPQTETELRTRHEQQAAQAAQQVERDRQAEQKAHADRERNDFTLTGSDRASDANPAQGDPLSTSGSVRRNDYHSEPSQAQKDAGNYRKEHVQWHGLDIAIENQAGTLRRGTDEDGQAWETRLAYDYGYLKGTRGADGDHVDVFLGPNLTGDKVFIVNQHKADGSFDEHKVMLGFASAEKAEAAYLANYTEGWDSYDRSLVTMSVGEFKHWLANGDTTKLATPPAGPIEGAGRGKNATIHEPAAAYDGAAAEVAPTQQRKTVPVSMRLSTGDTVSLDLAPAKALDAARAKIKRLEALRACLAA